MRDLLQSFRFSPFIRLGSVGLYFYSSLAFEILSYTSSMLPVCVIHAGNCTKIVLDPARSHAEPRYVLRHTSVCITCDHKLTPNETSNHLETRNVTWQLMGRDIAPIDGDVLQNGTLIIYNSSHVFQTQSATVLKCATTEYTTTNAIKLGSKCFYVVVLVNCVT